MQTRRFAGLFGSILIFILAGCAGDPPPPVGPPPFVLKTPQLQLVAPSALAAGDKLSLLGQDYVSPEKGAVTAHFVGVYQTQSGMEYPIDLKVAPEYVSSAELAWTFGPNIPFSHTHELGVFRGSVTVENVATETGESKGATLPVTLTVQPSLIIRQMRPLQAACSAEITDTIEDTPFMFEVEAVGLKAGTQASPLIYTYTFLKQNFNFEGFLSEQLVVNPESLFPPQGPVTAVQALSQGTVSRLGAGGTPSDVRIVDGAPTVQNLSVLADATEGWFGLTQLKTTALPDPIASYQDAYVTINAQDSDGRRITRTVPLRIWAPLEIAYDGNSKVVRSFDPVPVSGCLHGGDIGRDAKYVETTAEERQRAYTFKGEISGGFDIGVARLNAAFGVEVEATVSTSQAVGLQLDGFIIPNQSAVYYRQTLQLERTGRVIQHGPCGGGTEVAKVVVSDWVWAPDLAKGSSCPPLPPSNLPPGEIFD